MLRFEEWPLVVVLALLSIPLFVVFLLIKNSITMESGTFSCAINCMDGRAQDAVKNYVKKRFGVEFVDLITQPGPNKILADNANGAIVANIKEMVEISVRHHGTKVVVLAGHPGCAGNPASKEEQIKHLRKAKKTLQSFGFPVEIILLWVEKDFKTIEEVL